MSVFFASVRNGTAPDKLSRAQLVNLLAWDGVFSPKSEKLSQVRGMVEDLVNVGALKPHVVPVERKSWSHYRYPNPDKRGEWTNAHTVAGTRRDGRDLPAGAEPVVTWEHQEWFRPQDVAQCLQELGDKGADLRSEGLLLWLRQHGKELDASVKENRPPAGFEDDTLIKKQDLLKILKGSTYRGGADVEPKLDRASEQAWLKGCKASHGYFWHDATIDAFGRQGLLPGWRVSQPPGQMLRVVQTGT
jgi:hypothetical protein